MKIMNVDEAIKAMDLAIYDLSEARSKKNAAMKLEMDAVKRISAVSISLKKAREQAKKKKQN